MEGELVQQTRLRAGIARRMTASKQQIPHFYAQTEIAVDGVLAGLQQSAAAGRPASVTHVLIHSAASALALHREFNSVWTEAGLLRASEVNVSVAIAVDGGVFAPAIRDCDKLDVFEVRERLQDLQLRAAENRLRAEEISAGTFTLSNLGMYEVTAFASIITPPQVAALAVGRPVERLVNSSDAVTVSQIVTVTLSADHRAVDGVDAARFLATFKSCVESQSWTSEQLEV